VDELYENEEEVPCEIIRDGKQMKLILKIESDDNDEDESDDMSIYMIPNDSYMKSFDFLKKDFDSEELKEQMLDLRNRIQNYIEKINKKLDFPIIDV